ncbi:hypothetical protein [Brachyspira pulli]|uniref:hypothetical protein n=1 Tax=Brachyspira pulli TaxID=310721 RepID=UPI003003EA42
MSKLREFEKQEIKGDILVVHTSKNMANEIRAYAKKYNMKPSAYLVNTHNFYMKCLKENKKTDSV